MGEKRGRAPYAALAPNGRAQPEPETTQGVRMALAHRAVADRFLSTTLQTCGFKQFSGNLCHISIQNSFHPFSLDSCTVDLRLHKH